MPPQNLDEIASAIPAEPNYACFDHSLPGVSIYSVL